MTSVCPMRGQPAPSVAGMDGWRWVPEELFGELYNHLDNIADFDPSYPPDTGPRNTSAELLLQLKALLSAAPVPPVQGGRFVQVCKLGPYGSAYDTPGTYRAFTYAEQPNNPLAWKLGRALSAAHKAGGGDFIDYGLGLLKSLQDEGFGVFQIDATPQPACATCNDNGRIGGPSFYAPDEGGEPCPDCSTPQPPAQVDEREASGWIPVSERLPSIDEPSRVLIRTVDCGCMVASRGGQLDSEYNFLEGWTWDVINDISFAPHLVTHWMPLPPRPAPSADGGKVESDEVRRLRPMLAMILNALDRDAAEAQRGRRS